MRSENDLAIQVKYRERQRCPSLPFRILRMPGAARLDLLVKHVLGLCRSGETVLLVTSNQPASVLLGRLDQAGVDRHLVYVVDTLGDSPGIRTHDERMHVVPSPSMLELIGVRVKRILRRHPGRVRIIVNDCDTFALYNPPRTLQEYLRFVLHRWSDGLDIDFVVQQETSMDPDLLDLLRSECKEEIVLHGQAPSPRIR